MFSNSYQIKYLVAENCQGYNSKRALGLDSLGSISQSCETCSNYVNGKCKMNLFEDIASNISVN